MLAQEYTKSQAARKKKKEKTLVKKIRIVLVRKCVQNYSYKLSLLKNIAFENSLLVTEHQKIFFERHLGFDFVHFVKQLLGFGQPVQKLQF